MAQERVLPSSTSLAEVFQQKVSRRTFLYGVGSVGIGGLTIATKDVALLPKAANALLEYEKGFNLVSEARKNELLGRRSKEYLETYDIGNYSPDDERLCTLYLSVSEPTLLSFEVTTKRNPAIALPVFEVQVEDSQDSTVFSVIETKYTSQQDVPLSVIPEGDHQFTFRRTVASKDTADIGVKPFIPHSSTSFGENLLFGLPRFGMRHDTFQTYTNPALSHEERRQALLTGMLFFQDGQLREHEDGRIQVVFINGTTSEEGGLGRDPVKLLQSTTIREEGQVIPGRVYDYDVSVIRTTDQSGAVTQIANQHDTSTVFHQILPADGVFDPPLFPTDPRFKPYEEFQIVPSHGMTKFGMEYTHPDSNGKVQTSRITKQFALVPDFDYEYGSGIVHDELDRARRLIGVRVNLDRINTFFAARNNNNEDPDYYESESDTQYDRMMTNAKIALLREENRLERL